MEENNNKLSLKKKLIAGGIIGSFFSIIIFLVVIVTPVIILDSDANAESSSYLGYSSSIYLNNIYKECESINVAGKSMGLEEYIMGVVSAEAYTSEGMEALKAQAIAARTYAIKRTNNCSNSIRNSSSDQNYTSNIKDQARKAVEETKGLVLTYNEQIFLSEYDSFYKSGDYSCNDNGCSVTYTKQPNGETHKVTITKKRQSQAAGGHGHGMSQVASYDMAENNSTFKDILGYFYSPGVTISSLTQEGTNANYVKGNSASNGTFLIRNTAPQTTNSNDQKFYYSSYNTSYQAGYVGQCTWYSFGRANEVLNSVGSDLKWTCAGHAKTWYDCNIQNGKNAFSYSNDVTKPKPGAIIVWGHDTYGHVAFVENVNDDGTIDYSEGNIGSARNSSNPYGYRYNSHVSYTGTGIGTISNIWSGYYFIGYIYMVE